MELLIEKMNPSYKMENATTSVNEQDGHKAFVYARLSKDERGKKKYSLENQKDIAIRYAAEHGIHILGFLEDDDLSGYDFEKREGLSELKRLIAEGVCNMVIAKDLSRLGRDRAHILLLIEFFEENHVRYILVNENHDSLTDDRKN